MEEVFRQVVEEERHRGDRTVLLSSHILSEVEALCDRVTIIRAGRTVESGTLDELRHLGRITIDASLVRVPAELASLPGIHDLSTYGSHVHLSVDQSALDSVMRHLADAGLRNLVSRPPTLEELFLRHYQHDEPVGAAR
jgi:ABC-2 type transport system ATP-binding protein